MTKTYIPTLRVVVASAYRYGSRWQPKLEAGMTTEQIACFVTWLSATLALIGCLGPAPIGE